jgi:hypothetical protein
MEGFRYFWSSSSIGRDSPLLGIQHSGYTCHTGGRQSCRKKSQHSARLLKLKTGMSHMSPLDFRGRSVLGFVTAALDRTNTLTQYQSLLPNAA